MELKKYGPGYCDEQMTYWVRHVAPGNWHLERCYDDTKNAFQVRRVDPSVDVELDILRKQVVEIVDGLRAEANATIDLLMRDKAALEEKIAKLEGEAVAPGT